MRRSNQARPFPCGKGALSFSSPGSRRSAWSSTLCYDDRIQRLAAQWVLLIAMLVGSDLRSVGAATPVPVRPGPSDGILPTLGPHGAYVTSKACQECHPEEHASWHKSYHRTMTQIASTNSVLGPFDGTTIEAEGLLYRVFQENGQYWADMPDPDLLMYSVQGGMKGRLEKIPRVKRRVVMTTGSHHYQTFWVSSERHPTVLHTLPLVYLLEDRKWIPREAAFLHGPADRERFLAQWNTQCIRCHSTGGNPGLDPSSGELNTRVAELGIACEACHGPGEKHVRRQQENRRLSVALPVKAPPDDSILQPARLSSRASSEICGQCHGEYVVREEFAADAMSRSPLYKPGDDLHRTRHYIQHPRPGSSRRRWQDLENNPNFFSERWWPDGTILAGGREFTALRASACYLKGEISCLTCHSMHKSDPNDQLKKQGGTSMACLECHKEARFTSEIRQHTRHAPGSSGSDCMNCHMPHTSYALLKGIRSHQISSPRLDSAVKLGVPNACNLCHLDKTLGWAQGELATRYGHARVPLSSDQERIAASVLWLLKGDAAQRAISAWHFGWQPAREVSGTNWMAPMLAPLLNDGYGVVRQIAFKSLQSLSPKPSAGYDFLASGMERQRVVERVTDAWNARPPTLGLSSNLLMGSDGRFQQEAISRLLKEQDQRSVTVQE